jgi:hypothetical protein
MALTLFFRNRQEMKDSKGILRQAGEEWLMRSAGAYLPGKSPLKLEPTPKS